MTQLTLKKIKELKALGPSKTSDGRGLSFVIPKRGEPYWSLRYSFYGKRRELTLGKDSELSLAEARAQAENLRGVVRKGIDPLSTPSGVSGALTPSSSFNTIFQDLYDSKLKQSLKHPHIPERIYRQNIAPLLGHIPIDRITPVHIRDMIQTIKETDRPSITNKSLHLANQIFRHAIQLGLVMMNPAAAFSSSDAGGHEIPRERYLTLDEIEHAFRVFRSNAPRFSRDNYLACCLLLLLGVRKSELTESKWAEFDLENALWKLPAERAKFKRAISIALPPISIEMLTELKFRAVGSEYVFPNRRASKMPHMGKDTINRAIDSMFGIAQGKKVQPKNQLGAMEHFTVHDLRRTFRTLLSELGVTEEVAEACLNHAPGKLIKTYNRNRYFEERKRALTRLSETLYDKISPTIC
ncbi:tyrosine-type recombinase/integrase [Marinomonas gallaica]|uniref:tyrosine-type recombinase/integrase n=1 Tax=Marinomonas gallaica TaxID=1806667 RepID=UPI00082D8831|nr:site-specific integrase [Marinomonas gallaica]